MTLTTNQLLHRLYFDRAFTETARIIGYEGVELPAFWAATKKLGIPLEKLLTAVYELTRGDQREGTPPRYERPENHAAGAGNWSPFWRPVKSPANVRLCRESAEKARGSCEK